MYTNSLVIAIIMFVAIAIDITATLIMLHKTSSFEDRVIDLESRVKGFAWPYQKDRNNGHYNRHDDNLERGRNNRDTINFNDNSPYTMENYKRREK